MCAPGVNFTVRFSDGTGEVFISLEEPALPEFAHTHTHTEKKLNPATLWSRCREICVFVGLGWDGFFLQQLLPAVKFLQLGMFMTL